MKTDDRGGGENATIVSQCSHEGMVPVSQSRHSTLGARAADHILSFSTRASAAVNEGIPFPRVKKRSGFVPDSPDRSRQWKMVITSTPEAVNLLENYLSQ